MLPSEAEDDVKGSLLHPPLFRQLLSLRHLHLSIFDSLHLLRPIDLRIQLDPLGLE